MTVFSEIYFGILLCPNLKGKQMIVIVVLMITAMASPTNNTARGYSTTKRCLGADLVANGAIISLTKQKSKGKFNKMSYFYP